MKLLGYELICYGFGALVLLAGCIKLLDSHLLVQLWGIPLHGTSILVDLMLSGLLLFAPRDRRLFTIAASMFALYAAFLFTKLLTKTETCNCFGNDTPIAFPLIVDLVGLGFFSSLAFRSRQFSEIEPSIWKKKLPGIALFVVCVIAVALLYRVIDFDNNPIQMTTSTLVFDGESDAQKLELTLRNVSSAPIHIIGVPFNCQSSLLSVLPIELAPGESGTLIFAISTEKLAGPRNRFVQGKSNIFYVVGGGDTAQLASVNVSWGVVF